MTTETIDALVARLRSTPNWQRESFSHYKDCTCQYDRAPFEAADALERLSAQLEQYEAAIKQAWSIIDPFNPAGQPGSYARGYYNGTVQTLQAIRAAIDKARGK